MQNNLQKANEIIKRLAEYSRKYPPGMGYDMGHPSHDIAAEIEQAAKDYVDAEPEVTTMFTREQVEKMLGRAFDAGENHGIEDEQSNGWKYRMKSPDKQTTINNILQLNPDKDGK